MPFVRTIEPSPTFISDVHGTRRRHECLRRPPRLEGFTSELAKSSGRGSSVSTRPSGLVRPCHAPLVAERSLRAPHLAKRWGEPSENLATSSRLELASRFLPPPTVAGGDEAVVMSPCLAARHVVATRSIETGSPLGVRASVVSDENIRAQSTSLRPGPHRAARLLARRPGPRLVAYRPRSEELRQPYRRASSRCTLPRTTLPFSRERVSWRRAMQRRSSR